MPAATGHDCARAERFAALLREDRIDEALDAGLMDYRPCPSCAVATIREIATAQARLRTAWAARERYRAREARLARLSAQREARRRPASAMQMQAALPEAAAAALARALDRAGRSDGA
ncbi:hypothetical protein CSC70_07375 [Pseudoxanthomonas kalamensis DSM 18571]|uniref:hypothetical protein n=1 Tax=Pseudoxanthomonas kalamensis TaxID=289483 RepID=UPI001391F976|nr:hypothetical protein [Pseudoxanthomonas kalamensis]KAF1710481.1 hypothetical protein CSC70_07375 [Pseudoxanthomonas kalamensis DSM 18571]